MSDSPERIPFNKPFIAGKELFYIAQAVTLGNIAGDGFYTKACAELLETRFEVGRVLMTPSCTAGLEMAAMLSEIEAGDEVIMPSFTFVSTANAVARLGAIPVFVDIREDTLNLDEELVEAAITPRTKAICPVHYAGVACDMDRIMQIAAARGLRVIEDAAQGVGATYRGRALGSIGHLGAYSFHETKNYICGEGGALCINDPALVNRAEIIRDKGTNRQMFNRGEVDKYTWVEIGSSYVPSELCSAFLYGQLELLDGIRDRRQRIYDYYSETLTPLAEKGLLRLPSIPEDCTSNYHMFYVVFQSGAARTQAIDFLRAQAIHAVFHYIPLHGSPVGQGYGYKQGDLPLTEDLSARVLRLPMFFEITEAQQDRVVEALTRCLSQ